MFYRQKIRADQEYNADPSLVTQRELDMARLLIENLTTAFDPAKLRDARKERLQALIESKIEGKQIAPVAEVRRPAPVIDVTEALRKSLELIKKPAQPEAGRKPAKKRAK